jgi:hypothetical protein
MRMESHTLNEWELEQTSLSCAGTQCGEGRDMNAFLSAELDEVFASVKRGNFELIHCGTNASVAKEIQGLSNREVGDSNRLHQAFISQLSEIKKEKENGEIQFQRSR